MVTKKKQSGKKTTQHRSLRKTDAAQPFLSFQFTQQSVYWVILSALVLALGAWVMYLTLKVNQIYDDIDAANAQSGYMMPLHRR